MTHATPPGTSPETLNPSAGYWSDPSRIADAAVCGVVQVEWTGQAGSRLHVKRRNRGRTIIG